MDRIGDEPFIGTFVRHMFDDFLVRMLRFAPSLRSGQALGQGSLPVGSPAASRLFYEIQEILLYIIQFLSPGSFTTTTAWRMLPHSFSTEMV